MSKAKVKIIRIEENLFYVFFGINPESFGYTKNEIREVMPKYLSEESIQFALELKNGHSYEVEVK